MNNKLQQFLEFGGSFQGLQNTFNIKFLKKYKNQISLWMCQNSFPFTDDFCSKETTYEDLEALVGYVKKYSISW
jgi:hypothetical protein